MHTTATKAGSALVICWKGLWGVLGSTYKGISFAILCNYLPEYSASQSLQQAAQSLIHRFSQVLLLLIRTSQSR